MRARFTNLHATDLAVVWVPRGQVLGCYGTPKETHWGGGERVYGGEWVYDLPSALPGGMDWGGDGDLMLSGANYIKMPKSLPPKASDGMWLGAEGMVGLAWGRAGKNWVAGGAGPVSGVGDLLARLQGSGGAGGGMKRRTRRGVQGYIRSEEKGTVLLRAPGEEGARWVDVVVVNGTDFVAEGMGSAVYRSAGGGGD